MVSKLSGNRSISIDENDRLYDCVIKNIRKIHDCSSAFLWQPSLKFHPSQTEHTSQQSLQITPFIMSWYAA